MKPAKTPTTGRSVTFDGQLDLTTAFDAVADADTGVEEGNSSSGNGPVDGGTPHEITSNDSADDDTAMEQAKLA